VRALAPWMFNAARGWIGVSTGARFREDLLLDAAQVIENRAPVLTPIQPRAALNIQGARARTLETVGQP
jgi:hypothetical protein